MPTSLFSSFECNLKSLNGSNDVGVQLLGQPLGFAETTNISQPRGGNTMVMTAGDTKPFQCMLGASASIDNSGLEFAHRHGFGDGESFLDSNEANTVDGVQYQLLQTAALKGDLRGNRKRAPLQHLQVECNEGEMVSKKQRFDPIFVDEPSLVEDISMDSEPMMTHPVVAPAPGLPVPVAPLHPSEVAPPSVSPYFPNLHLPPPTRRALGEDDSCFPPRDMLDADQHSRAVANERLYHFKCLSSQLGSHLI